MHLPVHVLSYKNKVCSELDNLRGKRPRSAWNISILTCDLRDFKDLYRACCCAVMDSNHGLQSIGSIGAAIEILLMATAAPRDAANPSCFVENISGERTEIFTRRNFQPLVLVDI